MPSRSPTSTTVDTPADVAQKFANAINARVGPGKSISYKVLAWNLRVSEQTVWSWAKAEKAPSGVTLLRLLAFFDAAFANEILEGTGCTVIKFSDVQKQQAVQDALAVLARATA